MRRKNFSSMFDKSKNRKAASRKRCGGQQRKTSLSLETLEPRQMLSVSTFQQGAGGYTSTHDVDLFSISPTVNLGTDTVISVDQQDLNGERQGLLKFDNIFGSAPGQIPLGSTINSATLALSVFNESNSSALISLYRMKTNWDQNVATWNSFGSIGGVQASEGEAEALPDFTLFDPNIGTKTFDVATSLRHWASGEGNYGWLFDTVATNGWDFNTSEGAPSERPLLTVDYTAPSGAGQFQFLSLTPIQTEGDSGTSTALLQVARLGGSAGAVSVDYTISAGTATAGTDFVATTSPLTLNFAVNQTVMTIPVTINGDTALEGSETVTVTLSNAVGATIKNGADVATLTIADDDALINEVLANVSTSTTQTTDETNREYVELVGTPGASLNGYQFVIFNEVETSNGGTGSGVADLVVDLGGQSFGSNGLLVITPTAWNYTAGAGTNVFATAALDGAGGKIKDSSQTYALIKTPTPLVQGTDYDTVGTYESNASFAVGAGVGILDQLPVGAQLVDTVGVVQGGSGNRDRIAALNVPGIHIHEPIGNGDVTPDAITRRLGDHTPNSIGPWFDGEIENPNVPLVYAAAPKRNVVTPAGAQLTPGVANILRNVFFDVTAVSVNESAGSAILTVKRSGDLTGAIDVNYTTQNGTALAGSDYTATSGTLHFAATDDSENIVIPITADNIPEGFETFGVRLTSATSPFQITVPTATVTINDVDVLTKTFQDDVNGYEGTADTYLNSTQEFVNDAFGFASNVLADDQVGSLTGSDARPSQGLIRFDDLFGAAANQVPVGAHVYGAFMTVNVLNASAANAQVRFFRMLQNWDEASATWTNPQGNSGGSIINGVTPDDVEATAEPDAIVTNPSGLGLVDIPLNVDTIQAWANGTLSNFGWSIISNSGNAWNFGSSDDFLSVNPVLPKLTILYTDPSGPGTFRFSNTDYKVNENGTASVPVERVGGSAGAVDLNYAITPGTGSLADITGSATGMVHFNAGQTTATIAIPIFNDTLPESNETLGLTLSGTGVSVDRPMATLTIRDNDFGTVAPNVLLNELYINDPGNDGGHEFVELAGAPNATMGSLYLAVVDGNVGGTEGQSTLVVDLGSYANGSTGFSIVQAQNTFDFRVPDGVTQVKTPLLDVENLSNDTSSFFLLYSPTSSLATGIVDYDWDNDGSLELPAGVVVVDSIANKDNGLLDQTYGPAANRIDANSNPNLYVPDAISRKLGNTTRSSASAWYHGDLIASGDDPLVYLTANSLGLPSPGAAVTPGLANSGTPAQSPLVALTAVTPNLPAGTVTLTFNGPVSHLLAGANTPGVSVTDVSGNAIPGIDVRPVVTGLGTNTLTVAFSGAAVIGGPGGVLPNGTYKLSFVGNSLIGNGRAVDAANAGTTTGSNFSTTFVQSAVPGNLGDYSGNGVVDAADYTVWRDRVGQIVSSFSGADGNGNGVIDSGDYNVWKAQFGKVFPGAGAGNSTEMLAAPVAAPLPASPPKTNAVEAHDLALTQLAALAASVFKPASVSNAKLSSRVAASSTTSDQLLLLLAQQQSLAGHIQADRPAALGRAKSHPADDFFASLGEKPCDGNLATTAVGQAV
jgi:Calx-beta domain